MKYTISLIILLLLVSCGKKKFYHTIVNGIVMNAGTKQPIEGVEVYMRDGIATGGGFADFTGSSNTSTNAYAATMSDANGKFSIELVGKFEPNLYGKKDGYYDFKVVKPENFMYFSDGVHTGVKVEMKAESFFHPILMSNSAKEEDELSVYTFSFTKDIGYTRNISPWDFSGTGPHEFLYPLREAGDFYASYVIELTRDGVLKTILDSVYIKSFETYRDTIFY